MFTGIIQAVGEVAALTQQDKGVRLRITCGGLDLAGTCPGDSIAVSGVCLTATSLEKNSFWVDVSAETLSCTVFSGLSPGSRVNLELALLASSRLGGHLVSGHVDGAGTVSACYPDGASRRLHIEIPASLARYVAAKGSICLDGVSLTVNAVSDSGFEVNLVPHTLQATTLGEFAVGRRVNIEVDLIARYLERLLPGNAAPGGYGQADSGAAAP